jgi:hypothetical protein
MNGITGQLTLPPRDPVPIEGISSLLQYLQRPDPGYDVVVVGAAESALESVAFFRKSGIGKDQLDAFWFYREDHPLRKFLESRASRKEVHGAYLFYWLRPSR